MTDASRKLHQIFDEEWDHVMNEFPTWASRLGDRRANDRWDDHSIEAWDRRHEHDRKLLVRLDGIDAIALPEADRINLALFRKETETGVEGHRFGGHLMPLTQRGGIQTEDELADALRFSIEKDWTDWIARLEALSGFVDQVIALMREGIRRRVLQPRVVMQRVPDQIAKQIVDDPTSSPFYKPFLEISGEVPAGRHEEIRNRAQNAIEQVVVPAYRRFKSFFETEYLPACFEEVGIWQVPDGGDYYGHLVRKFTTTDMTPDQVHQIGLDEVARIRSEMQTILEKTGFEGDLLRFFEFLRTDPRFYYRTPDELYQAYLALSKRIDPLMVRVFKVNPRVPYGVEPIPDKIAPDTTTAYYRRPAADGSRAGTYFVNLYRPETRPKFEMVALSLHEAVPGHHSQIALAMERDDLPNFRRYAGYTAFIEGWGLYAEHLGAELGLYEDPYDKFGQLTYEIWRAIRLVVDTGLHHKRWTRQQAIDYFKAHAGKAELDIVNEVDRYISWPGQALAYKIGELKIKELRNRAREALGASFDVREFHDLLMASGAVPLDVAEGVVDRWIAGQKR